MADTQSVHDAVAAAWDATEAGDIGETTTTVDTTPEEVAGGVPDEATGEQMESAGQPKKTQKA